MGFLRSRKRKLYIGVAFILCMLSLYLISEASDKKHSDFFKVIKAHIKIKKAKVELKHSNTSSQILKQILDAEGVASHSISPRDFLKVLAQEEKCPACLGVDLCEEVNTGYIALTSIDPTYISNELMSFSGKLANLQRVTIKVPRPDILGSFDQIVCPVNKLKKWTSKCDSNINAENPFLLTAKQFISHENVKNYRKSLLLPPHSPSILACPNVQHKNVFIKAYDDNDDDKLSMEERNWFHTALTVAPQFIIHKVASHMGFSKSVPSLYGSCGRVFVLKGWMNPLSLWLEKPFAQRAGIAAKVLGRVEEFLTDSSSWIFFQPLWSIDNLQTDEKDDVYFSSVSTASFIEKKTSATDLPTACNYDCIVRIVKKLKSDNGYCISEEDAMHLMYSHACAMVLSNMEQHKFTDYFSAPVAERIQFRQFPGLLHGIPSHDKAQIEKLLASCVDESEAGDRLNSVEELQDVLADIYEDDDKDDDDDDYDIEDSVRDKSET